VKMAGRKWQKRYEGREKKKDGEEGYDGLEM
jgi:hypothetical protein